MRIESIICVSILSIVSCNRQLEPVDSLRTSTLEIAAEGARRFHSLTEALSRTHGRVAVIVDGEVVTAPEVHAPISSGVFSIRGRFAEEEARALAERILPKDS